MNLDQLQIRPNLIKKQYFSKLLTNFCDFWLNKLCPIKIHNKDSIGQPIRCIPLGSPRKVLGRDFSWEKVI